MTTVSEQLFQRAKQHIPGGVNSPVRSFNGVGGEPPFISRGDGAYLVDQDQNRYVDYICSWGALILGHNPKAVLSALEQQIHLGLSFGAPTELEIELAELVCTLMPHLEMLRLQSSGTEATMTAVRLARGYTKRRKIIKFVGCYHGHADSLLVKAGSGILTLGIPSSAGVPEEFIQHTLVAPFNDLNAVNQLFIEHGEDIAAVILEPIVGNMNFVPATAEFIKGLRALCTAHQSLLIFDEVMTGFRVTLGGAAAIYGVEPDLTTLGKVIGGGLPVGALGGKRNIMEYLAPVGPVYQAGTLSGNPLAVTAGLATLKQLQADPSLYQRLDQYCAKMLSGLKKIAERHAINMHINHQGSMFGFFFTDQTKIENYQDVEKCNVALFKKFFHAMLSRGVYLAPSAFEAGFIGTAHGTTELEFTLHAAEKSFQSIQ